MKLANAFLVIGVLLIPSLVMAREEPAPDMEMLEYLGGFETARGKPIDPLAFGDYVAKDVKNKQADGAQKNKKNGKKIGKQEQKDHRDEK